MKKRIVILSCMAASMFGAFVLPLTGIGCGESIVTATEADDGEEILSDEEVQEILNSAQEVSDDDSEDADTEEDEDADDEDDEDAEAAAYAETISDDDVLDYSEQNLEVLLDADMSSYDPETSEDKAYLDDWYNIKDEVGEYVSTDEETVERDGRKLMGILTTTCENAKVQFTFTFDVYNGLESITAVNLTKQEDENKTLGQSMANAGINTLLGMGTVFVMLIVIAFIISLFQYIPKLVERTQKKPKTVVNSASAPIPIPAPVKAQPDLSADAALVAVISAAIAAYEGEAGVKGFVVRSIRRH